MRSLVVLCLLAGAAFATPDETRTRTAFEAFVKAISTDAKTSAVHLDRCQFMFLPSADGVKVSPRQLVAKDLVGAHDGPVTWKVKFVTAQVSQAWSTMDTWIAADIDATDKKKTTKLHVTALVALDDKSVAHVVAAHWAIPVEEAKAVDRIPKKLDNRVVQERNNEAEFQMKRLAALDTRTLADMMTDNDGILIGSAPGEVIRGANAQKTIAAWPMKLAIDGGILYGGSPVSGGFWMAANVKGTTKATKAKGKDVTLHYRALFIYQTLMGRHGAATPVLQLAHFSIAAPP